MFGITDNPDGKTAFEQLNNTKKVKILLGEDITEADKTNENSDSSELAEETAPVADAEATDSEKAAAAEPKKPALAEPISEKALENTEPKKVPEPTSMAVEIGGDTDFSKKSEKKSTDKNEASKKTSEPKPAKKTAEKKKTNSLPDKPAASQDDFFNKPMSDEDKEAYKKAFGKTPKEKEEEKTEEAIPPEEQTAFQKTSKHKKERFWEDPFVPAEEAKEEPKPEKKPEPKPEKKTSSLPPKPTAPQEDDFFSKPLSGNDMEAFKKTFGKNKKNAEKIEEKPEEKAEEKAPEIIPPEEQTAFQKTDLKKKERFWEDPFAPKEEAKQEEPKPEAKPEPKVEIKPEIKPEPKAVAPKAEEKPAPKAIPIPTEKKTNSLPPMPAPTAEENLDSFFSKPLSGDDMEAFKKTFGKKTVEEKPVEKPSAFAQNPVEEKPVEKPSAFAQNSFVEKPAEKQSAFAQNPVGVAKPESAPAPEKKTNSLPPMPANTSSDSFFDKPVDPNEMAAFKNSFRKKPAPTEATAPKNPFAEKHSTPKSNPFAENLSPEDEKAAFERAFGKKIKSPEERAAEKRNSEAVAPKEIPAGEQTAFQRASAQKAEQKAAELEQQKKDDYIPIKLADMYNPANDKSGNVAAPVTSKDFKLEGIGEMYRPEKEFNREEFWENAKKGLNSEESREMYWALKREARDKKLKKGLRIALSLSIMGALTAVAMLISRESCFSYIQMGLTILVSFLLLMIAPAVKTLGILGFLFNLGWSGYFGAKFFLDTPFTTDTQFLIKLACYAVVVLFSLIIVIRLFSSKLLSEYYESSDKKERESIIKSNPMTRR